MLPYLSRVSLWLAALAAAASLFTPGQKGAWLASLAMVALIAALVLRRFSLKSQLPPVADFEHAPLLDDAALLDAATLLSRCIAQSDSLDAAVQELRETLMYELGVRKLTLHEPGDSPD